MMANKQDQAAPIALHDAAWEKQQQKAFTAWVNGQLRKKGIKIEDITVDLSDGRYLIQLCEVIGDAVLPKPSKGTMRIHKVQNVNYCLDFVKSKGVKLVSIGAEEIVDSNKKMILGMIWTLILRFDIQDISLEELSAKDALLLWCQRKTAPYDNVKIENFHMSWKDGLGFCALIHRHRPDLLDYSKLKKGDALNNLKLAIKIADEKLDVPPMIDAEDIVECVKPDERAIMTYVAAFYKCFANFNKNEVAAGKIAKVLNANQAFERMIAEYDVMASDLLAWVEASIARLGERPILNTVESCQSTLESFQALRKNDFPVKLQEKGCLESHYATLQTKLRLGGRPPFVPSEGKMVADIAAAWDNLTEADNANRIWVIEEFKRNKICAQKAKAFAHKTEAHTAWFDAQSAALTTDDYTGRSVGDVNALIKRHEAFKGDYEAREARVREIGHLANELDDLHYQHSETVGAQYADIFEGWAVMKQLMDARESNLAQALANAERIDALRLQFARLAAPLNAFIDETTDKLTELYVAESVEEAAELSATLSEDELEIEAQKPNYEATQKIQDEMVSLGCTENPFTTHTMDSLNAGWTALLALVPVRKNEFVSENGKQAKHESMRVAFADAAKKVDRAILSKTVAINGIMAAQVPMEEQVTKLKELEVSITDDVTTLVEVDSCAKALTEAFVFDNKHTHSSVDMLRGQWNQLGATCRRQYIELENMILTRDASGISEEQMKEFRSSFDHFDKNNSKTLDRLEFRGCLIALGYPIPQFVKEGESDADFEKVLKRVDPNGDGHITFDEFVAFMAEEHKDAETSADLLEAFTVLAGDHAYVTVEQLTRDLPAELAQYCIARMAKYEGGPEGALDFKTFSSAIYGEASV